MLDPVPDDRPVRLVEVESPDHPGGPPLVSDLQLFLDGIGRYPLLTAAEEVQLAKRVEVGDRRARDRMITSNLRLVVSVAKRYPIPDGSGLSLLDLIQEGMLGLMRAVELFDWRAGSRFSTYAVFWIRHMISRGLDHQAGTIRLPREVHGRVRALARAERELAAGLGRDPSDAEIASFAGVAVDEVRVLAGHRSGTASLNWVVQPGGSELGELIAGDHDVVEDVHAVSGRSAVRRAIAKLPARLRDVLVMRYGLLGDEPKSLGEVAVHLGVSRQRVCQLERQAFERIEPTALAVSDADLRVRRPLAERVGVLVPVGLLGTLKSLLPLGVTQSVAAGAAAVATAGMVAPVAFVGNLPWSMPAPARVTVESPHAPGGSRVRVRKTAVSLIDATGHPVSAIWGPPVGGWAPAPSEVHQTSSRHAVRDVPGATAVDGSQPPSSNDGVAASEPPVTQTSDPIEPEPADQSLGGGVPTGRPPSVERPPANPDQAPPPDETDQSVPPQDSSTTAPDSSEVAPVSTSDEPSTPDADTAPVDSGLAPDTSTVEEPTVGDVLEPPQEPPVDAGLTDATPAIADQSADPSIASPSDPTANEDTTQEVAPDPAP